MSTKPILSIICGFFNSGRTKIINNIKFDDNISFLRNIKDFYYDDVDTFNAVEKSINSNRVTILQPNVKTQSRYFNFNVTNADKRILFIFRHPGISWLINQHKLRLMEKGTTYNKTLSQFIIGFNSFFCRYMEAMKGLGYYRVKFESLLEKKNLINKVSNHIGVDVSPIDGEHNSYFLSSELSDVESSINLVSQYDLDLIYDELRDYMDHFEYKRLSLESILYEFSQLMGYDSIVSCLGTIKRSIGVDLDGTLAHYDGWRGISYIGKPIQPIVDAALKKEREGYEIVILTARAADSRSIPIIKNWLRNHDLPNWRITDRKDSSMKQIWDDIAKPVQCNEGKFLKV